MAVPPVPPPIAHLGSRPFSFYPSIGNIQHNEWIYRRATWSEVLVQNTKTNEEISVPRRYLGEVSPVDEPFMIVGLLKELEYRAGALWPAQRRVIEMPLAVNDVHRPRIQEERLGPAPVVGIRLEDHHDSRLSRFVLTGVALGIAGCLLGVTLIRGGVLSSRAFYTPVIEQDLGLSAADDYSSVVQKLGMPTKDRWQSTNDRDFRILAYPQRGVYVVLMGAHPNDARYVGTLDRYWRPTFHSSPMLRTLRRF